jgi:GT2 family glycosyltransferase
MPSLNNKQCPLVSVILLNYNGAKFASLWESFFKLDYPCYEIIFIDNGSHDNSNKFFIQLCKKYPLIPVKLVTITKNVGYSKANNIGLRYANGKYVFLVSNDVEVDKNWIKSMITVFESDCTIGVAQSMMYSLIDKRKFDLMWNNLDVIGFNHLFVPSGGVDEVFYSEGAAMFIRIDAIKKAGGLFDEDYFMFFEDVDFCWRVRLNGYKVVVVPSSIAYHLRGGTVTGVVMKTDPFYMRRNTCNRLSTLFKNYNLFNVIKYLPLSVLFEILTGLWLLSKRRCRLGLACLQGILLFVLKIPNLIKKRVNVQRNRKISDESILQIMLPLSKALSDLIKYSKMVN